MISSILINLQNREILCTFDKYGNIYFSLSENQEQLYEIVITNTNDIICEKYIQNCDTYDSTLDYFDVNIGELVPFHNNSTLRGKIIKEHNDDDDNESDSDREINDDIEKIYLQENLEFNEYINERPNYDEPYFSFNIISETKHISEKIIHDRESIHALYDTLIYQGTPESGNLIMKTTLINDHPLYRLCVYTSGDIKFRPIGSKDISYKLYYDPSHGLILTN